MADNQQSTSYRFGQNQQQDSQVEDAIAGAGLLIEPLCILQASMLRAWSDGLVNLAESLAQQRNHQQRNNQGNNQR